MRIAHPTVVAACAILAAMHAWLAGEALAEPGDATAAAAPRAPRAPQFEPCRLEHPSGLAAYAAECARLRVPENPAEPGGRTIELAIARVPAISRRKALDPLFLIAGGPGMGTRAMYPTVAAAFARIGRERDLVLVDQRGTGGSAALDCDFGDDDFTDADPAAIPALAQRCLDVLAARSQDVRQYTTSRAVEDLERVRVALGLGPINLYGVSYGTRVAQHYLRRHPRAVRAAILDGVAPPGLVLGPAMALDAEAALARILARCARDSACRTAYGDPALRYRALRGQLTQQPVDLEVADPSTGTPRRLRFGARHLATVLRLASYGDSQASLLPMALHEAQQKRNFTPLAGLFLMSNSGLRDTIAVGMNSSVVCAEDLPFVDESRIDRAALSATYLGSDLLDSMRAVCSVWPRGPVDADFRRPLDSDVPVLLLSGSDDPVTPPSNAVAAMPGLRRARHLVIDGAGHGQVGVTCMDRVLAAFIRDADPAKLDVSCLQRARPAPFFTTPSGPAP